MDPGNERLVFSRIVRNSSGPDRQQYFLITPKLLQVSSVRSLATAGRVLSRVRFGCVPVVGRLSDRLFCLTVVEAAKKKMALNAMYFYLVCSQLDATTFWISTDAPESEP